MPTAKRKSLTRLVTWQPSAKIPNGQMRILR